jgi:perosamine synthetase
MDSLLAVAGAAGVSIVEDAAEAVGALYKGRQAGSFGEVGVFSFHGSKTLTTGEGGMLVTDDEEIISRSAFLRDHGRAPGDKMFWNSEIGFKYKMSAMQAALGLAQLERIDELIARKREIFGYYTQALADIDGVTLNAEPAGTRNVYWMVTVVVDPAYEISKEQIISAMSERNIDCRPFFYPLSELPAYADSPEAIEARTRNGVAYGLSPTALNLPSALTLTREDVDHVATALMEILQVAR